MVSEPISNDEKRQALARVLASRTLARSDQLRGFLRFVCEAEFEGRAQQLNEYVLGVSVLGRPADYSPAEDSCVRSRAYELRNKLKSYYRSEAPDDPIEIQIDKGAYVPRFQRRAPEAQPPVGGDPIASPAAAELPEAPATDQHHRSLRLGVVALAISALLTAASLYLYWASRAALPDKGLTAEAATPAMRALWKPFLDSNVPLLLSVEIRLFFFSPQTGLVIRDYQTNQASEVDGSLPLRNFRERIGEQELRPTYDYADYGAVHAAFLLGRRLHREIALKPSMSLGWEDIWNSNIIFVGKPNLHPTVRHVLKGSDFVDELGIIRNVHPRPGESAQYQSAATHGAGQKYALITVAPGPQPGRRMMILSGSGSELMWALAESVTDPVRVGEIMAHLVLPSGEYPEAFQVVIEATFESNVPVKIRYVTHRAAQTP